MISSPLKPDINAHTVCGRPTLKGFEPFWKGSLRGLYERSIYERDKFQSCPKCTKKIPQTTCSRIAKCHKCGIMKAEKCKVGLFLTVTVETTEKEQSLHLRLPYAFAGVLREKKKHLRAVLNATTTYINTKLMKCTIW